MKRLPWWRLQKDHSPSVRTHCNPLYFLISVSTAFFGVELISLPWLNFLYTSRENLTLLPPNSKGAGQNTHQRSLIIAFIFHYLLTCQTANTRIRGYRTQRLINVFAVCAHNWINWISRAMIRLHKLCRLSYSSACKKTIFPTTLIKFIMKCIKIKKISLFI